MIAMFMGLWKQMESTLVLVLHHAHVVAVVFAIALQAIQVINVQSVILATWLIHPLLICALLKKVVIMGFIHGQHVFFVSKCKILKIHTLNYIRIFLACNCVTSGTIGGSTACTTSFGVCSCIDNVSGNKCDACSPGWYGFPSCQGEIYAKLSVGNYFWLLIFWNYLQNVFVMRMVQ